MNRTRTIAIVAGAILTAFWLLGPVGCAVKTPTARISQVEVNDVTSKMVRLRFVVKVNNPNDVTLTVRKISYSLLCFGQPVLKDTLDQKIVLPKKAESFFRFPITVKYSDLITAGIQALGKDKIEYTLAAKITLDTPVGPQDLPIKKTGSIKVKNLTDLFGKEEGPGSGNEIPFFDVGVLEVTADRI